MGLRVADQPGVLARIAQVFSDNGVSIELFRQSISSADQSAELRIVTHRASEADLAATVASISQLDVVQDVTSVLRVEGV